jgi:hypothetical protein
VTEYAERLTTDAFRVRVVDIAGCDPSLATTIPVDAYVDRPVIRNGAPLRT